MAELTHDAAEDGFHEIQLSGKQLVFLFMAMIVVFAVIFLCGVLVGRSVRLQRGEEPLNRSAEIVGLAPAEIPETGPPSTEPPPPPIEDELTYHSQLEGTSPKADPKVSPPTARPGPGSDTQTQAASQAPSPDKGRKPEPAAKGHAAEPAPAAAPGVPTSGRPGRWVVQVSALSNRTAAADMVQRLIGKGYPAFLVLPASGEPRLYRIQIGRYNDRNEAEQIVRRLAREEQFTPEIKR